jgi:ribosomal protein L11 methyltransferase|uniref:Methyltransferase domain-containing protein n=1 Tax=Mesoaciditoga lauensis TaxID=1495039 RepID=A0A7V3RFG7_9BACT
MKRKAYFFEIDKSKSDEILEIFGRYGYTDFYSDSRLNDTTETFHVFYDEEKIVDSILKEIDLNTHIEWIEDDDWIKKWSDSLRIVDLGYDLYVNPNPSKFEDPKDGITVKIIPGMAFGTGEHETTKLAIRFLKKVVKESSTVCDVGCGTGIISTFACKLGAKRVLALDIDQLAVEQAKETAKLNGVDYEVRKADLMSGVDEKFDIIVSNIYFDVILKLIDQLPANVIFIASGIDIGRANDFEKICTGRKMKLIEKAHEGQWCAFLFEL